MKIVRSAGLALVAIVLMGLDGASAAAAAEPLFNPANNQSVQGPSGLSRVRTRGGRIYHCNKDFFVGNVLSAWLIGNATVHFLECVSLNKEGEASCEVNSVGEAKGLILWRRVHGILGLVLPGGRRAILWLPTSGKVFTELEANSCTVATKVTGSVASLVEPIGKKQLTSKFVFSVSSEKQSVTNIHLSHGLGEVEPELLAFAEAATLEDTEEATFGEATEVT